MLDYARQRAIEVLKIPRKVTLVTSGPAGVQASVFPCEAIELELYILVPQISDHLFNLEHVSNVSLLADKWELKGEAKIISLHAVDLALEILRQPEADWSALVQISPRRLQIQREEGWGNLETIDIQSQ